MVQHQIETAAIQKFLMHLNLCGTEVKQTHHPTVPAEVETDFWFTCTFEKPLCLLQNTGSHSMILSNWFGMRFKFILKNKRCISGRNAHKRAAAHRETPLMIRTWRRIGSELKPPSVSSLHPSCSSASHLASNRPGAGVASLLAGYYQACQPSSC